MTTNELTRLNCIFCNRPIDIRSVSLEHIIPECLGGKVGVTTRNVCKKCNHIFGTTVDAELTRQRHIFDAYKNISKEERPRLEFWFKDAFYTDKYGRKIKFSKRHSVSKVIPTPIKNEMIIDPNDTNFLKKLLEKMVGQYRYTQKDIQKELDEIGKFGKIAKDGDEKKSGSHPK